MAASKLNDSPTDYDSDSITSENQPLNPCLVDTTGGHCPRLLRLSWFFMCRWESILGLNGSESGTQPILYELMSPEANPSDRINPQVS